MEGAWGKCERQEVTFEEQDGLQPEVEESAMVKYMDSGVDSLDSKAGSNVYYWVALRKWLSIWVSVSLSVNRG